MSILKELNESHASLKAIALNLFIIPFWYVAIFLFNNEFYKSSDSIIITTMCIVISLVSSVFFFIFLIKIEVNTSDNIFFEKMMVSTAMLIAWLSVLIFVFYSLGFLFGIYLYFYWFLVIYFFPLILFYLLIEIFGDDNANQKKENSK